MFFILAMCAPLIKLGLFQCDNSCGQCYILTLVHTPLHWLNWVDLIPFVELLVLIWRLFPKNVCAAGTTDLDSPLPIVRLRAALFFFKELSGLNSLLKSRIHQVQFWHFVVYQQFPTYDSRSMSPCQQNILRLLGKVVEPGALTSRGASIDFCNFVTLLQTLYTHKSICGSGYFSHTCCWQV